MADQKAENPKKPNFRELSRNVRIKKELENIASSPPPLCTACLKDSDLNCWVGTIEGPPGSPYEGGTFKLEITLPPDYPFRPPKAKFKTRIYHCNVGSNGEICMNTLSQGWSPALTMGTLLLSICSLMTDANPDSPLRPIIANQFRTQRERHDDMAREWTKRYAIDDSDTSAN